ncbi:winged helix-turn-helix domain-containing protein [Actinoallomurus spadix]|uniref:BTAD domain-containing putative transcriptional regulator n=1 Tax=Actinoallomurus spadix TaxID=79912 RepID=A0ABN0XSI8_9ACTN|nr:BTAD domain-containing putative transcriptional regulator [Actinoallomurus spadix]MCO5990258.1 winged helix-turn-helix domain-containing protein [Actinoallomurus spadix]
MWFGILGSLEVRSADGEVVPVGGPRPRALLVMLLLHAGRTVAVERLVDAQYGDEPPAGAVNAVQAQVSRLRRHLPPGTLQFGGTGYRLAVDPDDVDAHRFERVAREGRRLLSAGAHADAAAALSRALGLWRGPALADLPFADADKARLEELRLATAEDLFEAQLALPDGAPVAELRRLVAEHPLRERLRCLLMRALHAAGRPAEALAVFEETRRLLAEELGADPSPELAAIQLAVLRAQRPDPVPRRRPTAQLTSFVGRDRELARIGELRDARLITILSPGGAGKTRLAIEAAGRDPYEAVFADLSPLEDGDQVPRAVLGALGLRETGFQPIEAPDPVGRLVAALGDRELLLVLDNCEHVIAAAAALARRALGECPALRILATSREPLGITGETLVPLPPLDVPPPGTAPADVPGYPAARLFAHRAAAVRPGFVLTPDNAGAVARICAALDGLPLAIELAAARLRTFPVEEIARRLAEHDRFRLLSRGDRTAAARHRTLRAAVAWSWDLLTPEERAAARRFAVFTGGASFEAVEAVCGEDAADALPDLVDKSFVEADGARYRMFETIGLFCAERLAETGEPERVRAAHARHFLDLARRADPHLRGADQLEWLARLSADHDNLMAALRWSVREDRETAMRLVAALGAYGWLSGRGTEIRRAAAELLDAPIEGLEEEYVACVTQAVPRIDPAHWERAGSIVRSWDRPPRHPFTAVMWGMTAGPPGPDGANERVLGGDDPWNQALGGFSLGLITLLGGDPAEGERRIEDALTRFRTLGERWGTAQALDWLAVSAARRGEWARARGHWDEAIALFDELGADEEVVDVLMHRAEALTREGDLPAAVADLDRAGHLSRRAGRTDAPASVHLGLAEIARFHGDLPEARRRLDEARRVAGDAGFGVEATQPWLYTALGRLAEAEGDADAARTWHRRAVAAARESPIAVDLADAVTGLAGIAAGDGDGERAALLLGAAVALRGTTVARDRDADDVAARARDLVGAEAFAAAFARGAAMSRAEALTAAGETVSGWRTDCQRPPRESGT